MPGPSMFEICGGRSTVADTTTGTVWPPLPVKVTVAEGPDPSARLLRSKLKVMEVDEPGASIPDTDDVVNGEALLEVQLTG